jgi:hypothetical protein
VRFYALFNALRFGSTRSKLQTLVNIVTQPSSQLVDLSRACDYLHHSGCQYLQALNRIR